MMTTKPNVHILIPTYNVEQYIYSTLTSVKKQDYCNITTIIIDDNSIDSTKSILESFSKNNFNFEAYFGTTNEGIATRREQLIEISNQIDTKAYFLWLDADDIITDIFFVSKIVEKMLKNEADICLYNFSIEYEDNSEILKKNTEGLTNEKLNSENILSYITSVDSQVVSVDNYLQVASYSSLGWTKAYSPLIKNNWPSSEKAYIFEDFAYMSALFLTDRITAFEPTYQPIKHLRRISSSTGQRKPKHFHVDVIEQLLKFKKNLGAVSFRKETAANEFIVRKLQQYENALRTLILDKTQDFSFRDLKLFQKAKCRLECKK